MATLLLGLGSQGVPLGTTDTALGSGRARRSTENTFDPGYEGLTYAQVRTRDSIKHTGGIGTNAVPDWRRRGPGPAACSCYECVM